MKIVKIDGNEFNNIEEFYIEIKEKLTMGVGWEIGKSLDAFNDILRGGFGVHMYEESIIIEWISSDKSKLNLGYEATIKYYEEALTKCHPSNILSMTKKYEDAKAHKGSTFFDMVIEVILSHDHIKLELM